MRGLTSLYVIQQLRQMRFGFTRLYFRILLTGILD
jgi:hypothetical protein